MLSFSLPDEFIAEYRTRRVDWGFPIGGGNSLSELTFLTHYSRMKEDGTKERWFETCRRCVEGMYAILKDHCSHNRTPWNEVKAQRAAKDAYERLFTFRWTPPGRGLWMMGTEMVNGRGLSNSLQNCAALSTEKLSSHSKSAATWPFVRMMEMSMTGIGVGFDTAGADKLRIHAPRSEVTTFVVPDTREGWAESLGYLLVSYLLPNQVTVEFDYSLIRPVGAPLKTFGGTAAGAGPLIRLHESLHALFSGRAEELLSSSDIVDIMNLIGKAVVAGGARRSAQLALGALDDKEFLDLKSWEVNPERNGPDGWANLSNNSLGITVGADVSHVLDRIAHNGEPGLVYLDLCRAYGRLGDPPDNRDYRVNLVNPCGEQPLEGLSGECCTLIETYPTRHTSLDDYLQTLKQAYLYGKAVTLLPTSWPETNEVMQRNRRIGCSASGLAQFVETWDWSELRRWMDTGYALLKERDRLYSEWLGVRESIKVSTIKPSGTTGLLAAVTPGVHWPTADIYIRRMRLATTDPLVPALKDAGYHVEPDVMDPSYTVVVELPTRGPSIRTEREVTVWEKVQLAVFAQRHWSDNAVSVTATFREDERSQIGAVIKTFEGQLKTLSFLPLFEGSEAYAQAPYSPIDECAYESLVRDIKPLDWSALYGGAALDATGEAYCTTDRCEMPKR